MSLCIGPQHFLSHSLPVLCLGSLLDQLYTQPCHSWARAAQIAVPDGVSDEAASQYFANPLSGMHILPSVVSGPWHLHFGFILHLPFELQRAAPVLKTYVHIGGAAKLLLHLTGRMYPA